MFGWLREMRRREVRLLPEALWTVTLSDADIRVRHGGTLETRVAKDALSGVAVETRLACACPQGATGESAALAYLASLPWCDNEAMIRATGSADNAILPVWRRDA